MKLSERLNFRKVQDGVELEDYEFLVNPDVILDALISVCENREYESDGQDFNKCFRIIRQWIKDHKVIAISMD